MEDDLINYEVIDDGIRDIEGIPVVGISQLTDGSYAFCTTLSGPRELLWVLEQVKREVLEDYLG
jgi:hypothetical protein